ncbi:MAG: hypothetical protein KGZ88_13290 [Methylomicrobium sp.]|nr:hypothetical protein [Methylomicrobium sp.]
MRHFKQSTRISTLAAIMLGFLCLSLFQTAWAIGSEEVSGELDVIIKEDFDHNHFENDYFLRDENGQDWYQLQFERTPPGHLRSGQRIRVKGQQNGRKFRVESLEEDSAGKSRGNPNEIYEEGEMASAQVLDERKAVVLMVNLTNASAAYTKDQIIGHMYTNSRSVDGLYREASLGQLGFNPDADGDSKPDVFGPFAINYDNSTCGYYDWAAAAEAAAQASGIDLSQYRHRVFVLPNNLPSCSWAGIANVGCGTFCRAWIAGSTGMIFTHELGHNLNLAHAGTDPENDGTINSVYGDYSDPMGTSSSSWYLFNAGHIDQMGWYSNIPGAVSTVTAEGNFTLAAIGADPYSVGNTPFILKIAKPDTGDLYYLSYRQPIGNYNQLSTTYTKGINIHRYKGAGYAATTHIKTLINGETFTDSSNGISVTQLSQGNGYASLQVSFGCATGTPVVSASPSTLALRPGEAANFSVSVSNKDIAGCGNTTFSLEAGSNGISGVFTTSNFTLLPGQTGSSSLKASSAMADGSYTLSILAKDLDGRAPHHATHGQGAVTLIIDSQSPSIPSALKGSINRQGHIVLSWLASSDAQSGVSDYLIYRNNIAIGNASNTGYTDTTVSAGTAYTYTVAAKDQAGNVSLASSPVSISTATSSKAVGKK